MDNDPLYVLNNYGRCKLDQCQCIDQTNPRFNGAWGGLACPDWLPAGEIDFKSLIEHAKKNYKKTVD